MSGHTHTRAPMQTHSHSHTRRSARWRAWAGAPLAAALVALLAGCPSVPSIRMDAPASFRSYERPDHKIRMISPDGVRLLVREVENYPEADLPFWAEALSRHVDAKGYQIIERVELVTREGRRAITTEFLVARGAEDWVLAETLIVAGPRLILVEAAGPFDRFQPYRDELRAAIETLAVGP